MLHLNQSLMNCKIILYHSKLKENYIFTPILTSIKPEPFHFKISVSLFNSYWVLVFFGGRDSEQICLIQKLMICICHYQKVKRCFVLFCLFLFFFFWGGGSSHWHRSLKGLSKTYQHIFNLSHLSTSLTHTVDFFHFCWYQFTQMVENNVLF